MFRSASHNQRSRRQQRLLGGGYFASVLTAAVLMAPAPSSAASVTPILTATNPGSPGISTQPRIRGNADGVITSAVGARTRAITRATEPNATITIYTASTCTGPVAATGTAAELEGAGIAVSVDPDSETTFWATQTGIGGTSSCSNGITYRQVASSPDPPVFTGVTPASPADQNFPRLQGNVDNGAIVFIHDNAACSGSPLGSGSAAQFADGGIEVQVGDNTSNTFFAMATLAGLPSGCSGSSVSYQEVTPTAPNGDGTGGGGGNGGGGGTGGVPAPPPLNGPAKPPAPRLQTIPGGIANDATPTLLGDAPKAERVVIYASADCSGGLYRSGSSTELAAGLTIEMTPNTTLVLSARSVDAGGDRSACSEPVAYTHDSIAPRTRITVGPGIKTLRRTVVFRFTDITGGPQTSFRCKVDRKPWRGCSAPLRLKHLGLRRHVLKVKAYDAAGNREKRAVKRSFEVIRGV
jgi:hypothetical protein